MKSFSSMETKIYTHRRAEKSLSTNNIPLSSAEACCGEAGEKEKESAGFIFSIISIFIGIPSGSFCEAESVNFIDKIERVEIIQVRDLTFQTKQEV